MIEIRITITATTLTIGSWLGAEEVAEDPDRQGFFAGADRERGDDDLVEGEREGEQAAGDQRRAHAREGDAAEGLPGVGAEVGRGLLEGARDAPQAGDDVVVDDDDAEGRVADDHREEAEADAEHLGEGVVEGDAGDDPRQRDRQDDEEGDRLAAEEAVAADGERGEGAEQSAIAVAASADLDRGQERFAGGFVFERLAEPLGGQARRRPFEDLLELKA